MSLNIRFVLLHMDVNFPLVAKPMIWKKNIKL